MAHVIHRSSAVDSQIFQSVGYGMQPEFKAGPPRYELDGLRRSSLLPCKALTQAWLYVQMNSDATDLGGTCRRDSGAPKFLPGTNTIVATNTAGNAICRAQSFSYRFDTPQARAFLGRFVPLP